MTDQLYQAYLKHPNVVTDTRKIVSDSIFFALKGPNFNANQFALQALQNGCSYAVVDEKEFAIDDRFFLVEDVLSTLQQLARHHREQLNIPVLALTGSNGKTTTKELINSVLSQRFRTLATKGNLNNHIGVPLTLLEIRSEHEFAIIEMGANHQKEIAELCSIALPQYGMITNIGKAHIEGFGSEEGIRKGKGELFAHLRNGNFKAFVNGDSEVLMEMSEGMDRLVYGHGKDHYLQGRNCGANPFLELEIFNQNEIIHVKTQLIGKYNFDNALAAAAIGKFFGLSMDEIKKGLETYLPENNRSQIMKKGSNTLIMDAYNANPSSMKVALENFAEMKADKKLFIIGDMLELGEASLKEHRNIIHLSENLGLKGIFIGPIFGELLETSSHEHFLNAEEAKKFLVSSKLENHHLLIKGSRGMKLESLVDSI